MFGQDPNATGPDWGIIVPPDAATAPAGGGFFSQLPQLFTNFEQARVYNAATNAQVAQMNQLANINPAWILAGLLIVFIAFARR
jgi:hypothetical protein